MNVVVLVSFYSHRRHINQMFSIRQNTCKLKSNSISKRDDFQPNKRNINTHCSQWFRVSSKQELSLWFQWNLLLCVIFFLPFLSCIWTNPDFMLIFTLCWWLWARKWKTFEFEIPNSKHTNSLQMIEIFSFFFAWIFFVF